MIFFINHVDKNTNSPLQVNPVDDIAIRYYLYEDMSRIIRGNAISIFGLDKHFLGYTPSLDTPEIHVKRVETIKRMIEEVGILSISGGNLQEICQTIYKIIRSSS